VMVVVLLKSTHPSQGAVTAAAAAATCSEPEAAPRHVGAACVLAIPHQRLVVLKVVDRVVQLPAVSAKVLEAGDVAAKVGPLGRNSPNS
jgi:hypothetical protein